MALTISEDKIPADHDFFSEDGTHSALDSLMQIKVAEKTSLAASEGVERDDYTDETFKGWSPSALWGVNGCCWGCCLPQAKIGTFNMHKCVDDLRNCPNRDIIKSAIYAWALHPLDALQPRDYAPQHVVHDLNVFWGWLGLVDHGHLLNLHVVFAKLIMGTGGRFIFLNFNERAATPRACVYQWALAYGGCEAKMEAQFVE
ncbi:hypothetical protein B0H14DRAFT_3474164 [Mycena olivaceomarginata]|nr:hypothetical protein B0H14DRAFT_3474164 [Mycena olivaceomarginata]